MDRDPLDDFPDLLFSPTRVQPFELAKSNSVFSVEPITSSAKDSFNVCIHVSEKQIPEKPECGIKKSDLTVIPAEEKPIVLDQGTGGSHHTDLDEHQSSVVESEHLDQRSVHFSETSATSSDSSSSSSGESVSQDEDVEANGQHDSTESSVADSKESKEASSDSIEDSQADDSSESISPEVFPSVLPSVSKSPLISVAQFKPDQDKSGLTAAPDEAQSGLAAAADQEKSGLAAATHEPQSGLTAKPDKPESDLAAKARKNIEMLVDKALDDSSKRIDFGLFDDYERRLAALRARLAPGDIQRDPVLMNEYFHRLELPERDIPEMPVSIKLRANPFVTSRSIKRERPDVQADVASGRRGMPSDSDEVRLLREALEESRRLLSTAGICRCSQRCSDRAPRRVYQEEGSYEAPKRVYQESVDRNILTGMSHKCCTSQLTHTAHGCDSCTIDWTHKLAHVQRKQWEAYSKTQTKLIHN